MELVIEDQLRCTEFEHFIRVYYFINLSIDIIDGVCLLYGLSFGLGEYYRRCELLDLIWFQGRFLTETMFITPGLKTIKL